MSTRSSRKKRWPLGLAAILGFLLLGSVVAAVVSERRIEGSVPGGAPILGLAAVPAGLVIATSDGVLVDRGSGAWERLGDFGGECLVAGAGSEVVVVSEGHLYRSSDLISFSRAETGVDGATALAATPEGVVYVALGANRMIILGADDEWSELPIDDGPPEILALAAGSSESSVILAGGLSGGLWRSEDGGKQWIRILGTPIRAALVDRGSPGRLLIGTAGGVLTSTATDPWEFTDMRSPVEALAEGPAGYLALTADRLLYESQDGLEWTRAAPVGE